MPILSHSSSMKRFLTRLGAPAAREAGSGDHHACAMASLEDAARRRLSIPHGDIEVREREGVIWGRPAGKAGRYRPIGAAEDLLEKAERCAQGKKQEGGGA